MSRGFVKEEDQEEAPFIPPRAALPHGVTNYVTPEGLQQLRDEKKQLEESRGLVGAKNETEARRARAIIDGKLKLLNERISTARVLDPGSQATNNIRFGAKVLLEKIPGNQIQEFKIVGVDEADVKKHKIAFVAPLARAVTGKKEGELVELNLGSEVRRFKIFKISY